MSECDLARSAVDAGEDASAHLAGCRACAEYAAGVASVRELARALPEMVNTVITLGSPIQMTGTDRSSAQAMWKFFERFHSFFHAARRHRSATS